MCTGRSLLLATCVVRGVRTPPLAGAELPASRVGPAAVLPAPGSPGDGPGALPERRGLLEPQPWREGQTRDKAEDAGRPGEPCLASGSMSGHGSVPAGSDRDVLPGGRARRGEAAAGAPRGADAGPSDASGLTCAMHELRKKHPKVL